MHSGSGRSARNSSGARLPTAQYRIHSESHFSADASKAPERTRSFRECPGAGVALGLQKAIRLTAFSAFMRPVHPNLHRIFAVPACTPEITRQSEAVHAPARRRN